MTESNEKTDYSQGKIYVIISPFCELVYYGSTTETLKQRFSKHKANTAKCTSKKIIDAGDADIYEIEKFPCSCKEELEDREALYILNDWDGCVNEYVPGAIRRAGGRKAYMKKRYNEIPEVRQRILDAQKKPEAMAKRREYERNSVNRKIQKKTKTNCIICNARITIGGRAQHRKTKRCQNYLKNELDNLMNDIITQIEIEN